MTVRKAVSVGSSSSKMDRKMKERRANEEGRLYSKEPSVLND